MRSRAASLSILFVVACSAPSSPPPVAATLPVDPFRELVEVPYEMCPRLAGWLAFSPGAMEFVLNDWTEKMRDCKAKVAGAETRARIAEERFKAAQSAAGSADWWARWGVLVGGGLGLVAGVVVGVVGGVLGGKYARP